MLLATLAVALLLGLAFGSFLNVCIVRLPLGQSIVSPRSRCPACGNTLQNRDNIPLLSYLLLRGRCRNCDKPISPQYPLVEAAAALWFLLSAFPLARALQSGEANADTLLALGVHAAATAALGFLLLGLIVIDWKHHLLPNEFTLGGLALGILFAFTETFFVKAVPTKVLFTPEETFIAGRIGAALLGFLLLWSIGALYRLIRHRQGMGAGDAKLAAMLGAFLGIGPLAVALFLGITLAAIAGVALLLARRANATTRLPFGSYLGIAGLFAALWGDRIAAWYRALFV